MTKANNFQRIRELNYLQKAVLGGALLERMLPNYSLFSEATGFGDAAVFRSALSVCWEKILLPKSKISLEQFWQCEITICHKKVLVHFGNVV